ncbi:hypothetical protein [Sphingomicrobium sediminis]|uniref:Transmembrane protein (PGPGW) n=1 Tax=Sphingomicrobium sediminis TaxID=2950949 RepID=A0A9X2EK31_9SPHN|nr:hypothetical protein [Sphingomicrobium sediminis]MCM8557059.1 hypothetical protein [Sphingomicrobium sediminis]
MGGKRKKWIDKDPARTIVFAVGAFLIVLSPIVGAIPGPGGLFVFAAGLALCLRTSRWARRQYVRFKRWQPEAGRWADWGLQRKSAKRREALRKQGEPVRDAAKRTAKDGH